jgi:hypothetical protein
MNSDDRPTRIVFDLDSCKTAVEENRIFILWEPCQQTLKRTHLLPPICCISQHSSQKAAWNEVLRNSQTWPTSTQTTLREDWSHHAEKSPVFWDWHFVGQMCVGVAEKPVLTFSQELTFIFKSQHIHVWSRCLFCSKILRVQFSFRTNKILFSREKRYFP